MKDQGKPILVAFAAGLALWLIDAAFQVIQGQSASLADALVPDIPSHTFYIRATLLAVSLGAGIVFARLAGRVGHSDSRRKHLSLVLHSIKEADQALLEEPDREALVTRVCEALVGGDGYHTAWAVLIDKASKYVAGASSGLDDVFPDFVDRYQRGVLPVCVSRAVLRRGVIVVDGVKKRCSDCPVRKMYGGRAALTARLEHDGIVLGFISATIPARFAHDEDEHALFQEVATDVAEQLVAIEAPDYRPLRLVRHSADTASPDGEPTVECRDAETSPDASTEEDVLNLLAENERLTSERDAMAAEVERLTSSLAERDTTEGEQGELESELSAERARLSAIESELAEKNEKLSAAQSELAAQNEKLSAAQSELAAKNEELSAAESELAAQNEKLNAAESELATQNEKLSTAESELASEREQAARAIKDTHGAERMLAEEKQKLIAEIERLRDAEGCLSAEKKELELELERRTASGNEIAAERDRLVSELESSRESEVRLAGEKEELASTLARLGEAEAESGSERERLARELSQQAEARAQIQAEKEKLERQLNEQAEFGAQIQAEKEKLERQLSEQAEVGAQIQAEKEKLERQLSEQAEVGTQIQAEKEKLERQLSEQAEAQSEAQSEKERLAKALNEHAQARATLESEKAELERQLAEVSSARDKLATDRDELSAARDGDKTIRSELEERVASYQTAIADLESENAALGERLSEHERVERQLADKHGDLRQKVAAQVKAERRLEAEKVDLERRLLHHRETEAKLATEKKRLRGEVAEHRKTAAALSNERDRLASQLDIRNAELSAVAEERDRLTAALHERGRSEESLSEEKERLTAELAERDEKISGLAAERQRLEQELAERVAAQTKLAAEKADVEARIEELTGAHKSAAEEKATLAAELEKRDQRLAALERAQDDLRKERDGAEAYLNLADAVFVSIDADETVAMINRRGCEMLGVTQEEAVGQNWFDCFVPDDEREATREIFRRLMSGDVENTERACTRLLTRSGDVRTMDWSNALVTDADGRIVGTVSSGIDMTDREHEETVRQVLYEIASVAHDGHDRTELFRVIQRELGRVINTENFFIALYDKASDTISLPYFVDEKDVFHSFPAGKTLTGHVIRTDSPLLATKEQARKMAEDGIVEVIGTPAEIWLGVPLRAMGEVIGALVVQSYSDASEFGARERDILEFVSGQVGQAIERSKTEQKLEFLGSIPKQVSDAIIVTDLDFKITYVNRATEELYGYELSELLGQTPAVFNADMKAGEIQEDIYTTVTEGGVWNGTILNRRKDDTTFMCDFRVSPLREASGRLTSYIAVLRDVSELKRTERLLQAINAAALAVERTIEHDEIFAAVGRELDTLGLSSALLLLDDDGRTLCIDQVSYTSKIVKAAERLVGVRRENVELNIDAIDELARVVRNGATVYIDDPEPLVQKMLPSHAAKLAKPAMAMLKMRHVIAAPMMDSDRTLGVLTVHADDLSERDVPTVTAFANQLAAAWRKARLMEELKRSFEELEETEGQLVQAQKMEAVGRLAGGVAHDFNNLLTAITGYTDLSMNRLGPDSEIRDDLVQIKKAAAQAATLTKQLLAFSRRQPLSPTVVDINEIVNGMDQMLRPLIGEDIELLTTLQPDIYGVEADAGQIQQVILNLAVNARDAMPNGGTISLRTENVTIGTEEEQQAPDSRPGDFVRITVQDTGEGIDKGMLSQIFEPFFTTKEKGRGTGLGLSVAYGIVKQHQGWMDVDSERGRGTTFRVHLPSTKAAPVKTVETKVSVPEFTGKMERILLVEDEEAVRAVATRALTENGYVVTDVGSAEEALEIFESKGAEFDLVFSDVVLPKKSGVQLADEITAANPDMPILLSSGYTEGKSQWPIIRDRGFRFLQKPYAVRDLFRTIREIMTEQ